MLLILDHSPLLTTGNHYTLFFYEYSGIFLVGWLVLLVPEMFQHNKILCVWPVPDLSSASAYQQRPETKKDYTQFLV